MNSLNSELQLKDNEFAIKKKLIDLLSELRGLKLLTTLVLWIDEEKKNTTFYSSSISEKN